MTKLGRFFGSSFAFTALILVACAPAPAKKDAGTLNVDVGKDGAADGTSTGVAGTSGAAGDPTGAAGTAVDPTGAAGSAYPGGAGSGAAGTGAAGAGTAGTTGAAGTGAPDAGAAGTGARDAGTASDRADVGVTPVVDPCNRATWTFTPSVVCATCGTPATREPANAIDGNPATRYTSGIGQGSKGAETATLAFPAAVTLSGIRIVTTGGDGPSIYRVDWSTDRATFWTFEPAATGPGGDDVTVTFPAPKSLVALRVTQLGLKPSNWWSIHELSVTGCKPAP